MSKEQQFLIDSIIDDVARYLMEDNGLSIIEALDTVYNSQLYDRLSDTETGLYTQSSTYNYEYLKREMRFGKMI